MKRTERKVPDDSLATLRHDGHGGLDTSRTGEQNMGIFSSKKALAPVKGEVPPAGTQAAKELQRKEDAKKKSK